MQVMDVIGHKFKSLLVSIFLLGVFLSPKGSYACWNFQEELVAETGGLIQDSVAALGDPISLKLHGDLPNFRAKLEKFYEVMSGLFRIQHISHPRESPFNRLMRYEGLVWLDPHPENFGAVVRPRGNGLVDLVYQGNDLDVIREGVLAGDLYRYLTSIFFALSDLDEAELKVVFTKIVNSYYLEGIGANVTLLKI